MTISCRNSSELWRNHLCRRFKYENSKQCILLFSMQISTLSGWSSCILWCHICHACWSWKCSAYVSFNCFPFFFCQLMFLVANLLDMHGNLLLLYVSWMLHVGSMELQVEWVLEKGTSSLFCSLMNIMFTIFAISTLKTIPQASNFSRRNCFHFAYLFITYN